MLKTLADMVRSLGGHEQGDTDQAVRAGLPLLPGQWTDVAPADALALMVRVAARVEPVRDICARHDVTAVRSRPLECVAQGLLIAFDTGDNAGDAAGGGAFIYRPGIIDPLDGQSARLHRLADEGALRLDTAARALEYCQLFAASVQGGEGCFFPLQADMPVHVQQRHPCAARSLASAREPFSVAEADGDWEVGMTVAYSAALFRASFRVGRNGTIEMIDDRILCGIAPASAQTWQDGLRLSIPVAEDEAIGRCHACPLGHSDGDGEGSIGDAAD